MTRLSETQVLEHINSFYRTYDNAKLKSRTQVDREMKAKYPNWQRDAEQREKIRKVVLGRLPIDEFDERQKALFDEVFKGWRLEQIEKFADKYDEKLHEWHNTIMYDDRFTPYIGWYVYKKREEKMRQADERLRRRLGDSLGFTGFNRQVTVHGGKKVNYSDLQNQWYEERKYFSER